MRHYDGLDSRPLISQSFICLGMLLAYKKVACVPPFSPNVLFSLFDNSESFPRHFISSCNYQSTAAAHPVKMTSSDQTEALYWRSYVKAIAQVRGPAELGSSRIVFVASQHNRSIAASRFIPLAVSNELLYQVSNSLLDPSSVFYSPSSSGSVSYFQSLRRFVSMVLRIITTTMPLT